MTGSPEKYWRGFIVSKFDITKHKWSDENTRLSVYDDGSVDETDIELFDVNRSWFDSVWINKDDAIAIAKHFNLLSLASNISVTTQAGQTVSITNDKGEPIPFEWHEDI